MSWAEPLAQQTYTKRESEPPQRSPAQYAENHDHAVEESDSVVTDSPGGKQCDKNQNEGRIGQRDKKDRKVIAPEAPFAGSVATDLHGWIFQKDRHADNDHGDSTESFQNVESAVAAPNPETNPERWLLLRVRWMHMTPIGPSGIDATSPMTKPFSSAINSISQ